MVKTEEKKKKKKKKSPVQIVEEFYGDIPAEEAFRKALEPYFTEGRYSGKAST